MRGLRILALIVSLTFCVVEPSAQETGGSGGKTPDLTVKVDGVDEPVYRIGREVKPPRPIYQPAAQFSDEARRNGTTGTVMITMVVTSKGDTTLIKITQGLGSGLDEKAIEAVRQWKFKPATKNGQPVSVQISVEVSFH